MFSNHDNLIIKIFFTRKNGTQINGNITTKVKNNLNFKEIWTLEEGKKFIDFLYEIYK